MHTFKLYAFRKIFILAIIGLPLVIMIQSCSHKYSFANSSVVPAAEGSVKVNKDKNNNYDIELRIMRLADSKRLSPSKELYIVWAETQHSGTKNIGQLNTSSGFLSNTLKSSLKTVIAFKPTKIFITGEDINTVQYPHGQIVLSTNNF